MALPLCRALTRLVPLRCAARPRLPPLRRPHSASSGKTNPSSAPSAPAAPKLGSRPGSALGFGPGAGPRPAWRRRLGLVTSIVEAYGRAQRARPYRTQLVGAVFVYLAADLGAQHIGGREYDPIRTGRSLLIGLVAAIPYYKWFQFLSLHFNYASPTLSLATKVVVNQLLFTPTFSTYFFGAQALLAGDDLVATTERVRDTVPASWRNSFKVWPAAVALSFALLPIEYRALFNGCVAVGWQTYLSYLNKQAELRGRGDRDDRPDQRGDCTREPETLLLLRGP